MLHLAASHSLLPPVGVESERVHTLQFAVDMLLFFDGSTRSAGVIKVVLDAFAAASRLIINYGKCAVVPVNLPGPIANGLADLLGCPVAEFPVSYLGLPLSPKALRKEDYFPFIEKLDKRLAGWKGRLLSRAGRLVLFNAVLTSIPVFFYSAFRLPVWVTNAIDKIRRGFFWKGHVLVNDFHCLVNWGQVCRPRNRGGLGIKKLTAINSALLMKGLWNFYFGPTRPWARILCSLHYKRRPISAVGPTPPRCSPLWKAILATSSPFHTSVGFHLGDGKAASFWHTRWAGEVLFRNRFPGLFAAATHKHLVVDNWLQRFGSCPAFGFTSGSVDLSRELSLLYALISAVRRSNEPDRIFWRWDNSGLFTVGSAYRFLYFDGLDDRRVKHLWTIKTPPRIKLFLWLAARNRILTAELLCKRGWIGHSICTLCGRDSERPSSFPLPFCQGGLEVDLAGRAPFAPGAPQSEWWLRYSVA